MEIPVLKKIVINQVSVTLHLGQKIIDVCYQRDYCYHRSEGGLTYSKKDIANFASRKKMTDQCDGNIAS